MTIRLFLLAACALLSGCSRASDKLVGQWNGLIQAGEGSPCLIELVQSPLDQRCFPE
jgi:hypothetical protein